MRIFAISDLHLSGANPKPMDIFGRKWENHWEKIKHNWRELVQDEDVVLIPGDISWAMKLHQALVDLNAIGELPGRKIIVRGNHDYWWNSISKIRDNLPLGMYIIQNDSVFLEGIHFCGTRSWDMPGGKDDAEDDLKIFKRELERLKMSLSTAKSAENIIVLLHFPPFNEKGKPSEMLEIMNEYKVSHVVYGHLHGHSYKAIEGNIDGINYHLVSCDYLDFIPKLIE